MPKDRDQLTPDDPEDAEHLATHRGQGAGGTGFDVLAQPGDPGGTVHEPVDGEAFTVADPAGDPGATGPEG